MTHEHFIWARTESEAKELQALGWKKAEQRVSHHSRWALLLKIECEGDPPVPPEKVS